MTPRCFGSGASLFTFENRGGMDDVEIFRSYGVLKRFKNTPFNTPNGNFWEC